jgi:hypothetical protein
MEQCGWWGSSVWRGERLQVLLEILGERDPYTPAFLRKSAETIEWRRAVKHSLGKERKERGFQNGKSRPCRKERGDLAEKGMIIHGL